MTIRLKHFAQTTLSIFVFSVVIFLTLYTAPVIEYSFTHNGIVSGNVAYAGHTCTGGQEATHQGNGSFGTNNLCAGSVVSTTRLGGETTPVEMGTFEYFYSGAFLISLTGILLGFAGWMLNGSVQFFIIEMGTMIGTGTKVGDSINTSWAMIRDIINLTFVFGLLYIAFMTIFKADTSKLKHAIVQILIGALLINFSLFFAKVVIDISNVAAVEIFQQISTQGAQGGQTYNVGISGYFMNKLGVTDFVEPLGILTAPGTPTNKVGSFGFGFAVFVSLIFLVTSFVFIAGAILISIRFVVLVFLLILSPVAFASAFIPKLNTEEWSRMWWDKMISQAIFAPAYLLLILIAMKVADMETLAAGGSIIGFFSGAGTSSSIAAVLNFVLIIGFLVGAIIIAKKMGAYGASTAASWGTSIAKGAGSIAGRNTVGRYSDWRLKRYKENSAARSKTRGGRLMNNLLYYSGAHDVMHKTLDAGKNAKFGGGHSYESAQKAHKEYNAMIGTAVAEGKLEHVIETGLHSANPRDAIEMERALKDASVHDIEELGDKTFLQAGVVGAMTHSQIEGLMKSDKLNAIQKAELGKIRQEEIKKRIAGSGTIVAGIPKASAQQLKALGSKVLTEEVGIAAALTASQMDDLKKEFTETEFAVLKTARTKQLSEQYGIDAVTGQIDGSTANVFFGVDRKDTEVAKLPKEILTHSNATKYLNGQVLKRIADNQDLTRGERNVIRQNIDTLRNAPPAQLSPEQLANRAQMIHFLDNTPQGKNF